MGFKCGIIGLPNVGKSTLFNALTETAQADAENYPFCTIEPNIGNVVVPDKRLKKLAEISKSKNIIPAQMQFVDIAGLVEGASKGEGLGNQFLSHIREVDSILHVLRCFENTKISHVYDIVDPIHDAEIIETELILADLTSLEKQISNLKKKIRNDDIEPKKNYDLIKKLLKYLSNGISIRKIKNLTDEERSNLRDLNLLTSKPQLYVCNVSEEHTNLGNHFTQEVIRKFRDENTKILFISSLIESEISALNENEKNDFIRELGFNETGLSKLIKSGYELLNLITFFTSGEKETRAWTLKKGLRAPQAAGKIHSDFEKGFIRAETISYDDYIKFEGEQGSKEAGKLRVEGSDYLVKDGDIFNFRFNV